MWSWYWQTIDICSIVFKWDSSRCQSYKASVMSLCTNHETNMTAFRYAWVTWLTGLLLPVTLIWYTDDDAWIGDFPYFRCVGVSLFPFEPNRSLGDILTLSSAANFSCVVGFAPDDDLPLKTKLNLVALGERSTSFDSPKWCRWWWWWWCGPWWWAWTMWWADTKTVKLFLP